MKKTLPFFLLCIACIFFNGCIWIAAPVAVPPTDKYYYIYNNSSAEMNLELLCKGKRSSATIAPNNGAFFYLPKGNSRKWFCIEEMMINNKKFDTVTNTSLPQPEKNGDTELICLLFVNDSLYKLTVNYTHHQKKDPIPDIYSLSSLLKSFINSDKSNHQFDNGHYFIDLGNYKGFHLSLHNMKI